LDPAHKALSLIYLGRPLSGSNSKDTFYFTSSDQSPARFIELFREFYGPTMNAYEAARKNGKEDQLHAQLIELANSAE
jgi:hypothetical protein